MSLETADQEEEQSCFSDTTDADFRADLDGIERDLIILGKRVVE